MERILVQFRGQTTAYALPKGPETTWIEIQGLFFAEMDVAVDAQRVFYQKKRIDPQDTALTLRELGWDTTKDPLVTLMVGASQSQIEEMERTKKEVETEERIRANRRVVSIQRRNQALEAQAAVSTDYRFHAIEVLENFSDSHRAREILEQLANDRGILAVMAKHKWSVGCLAEMYPEGKVGVDPVCVLGLNQNKGQKILLRLRTDDLQGFRKYLNIKKVLFHELSHNVHSEHDIHFYQLMRQVEKECDELDWTHSQGSTVGGSRGTAIIEDRNEGATASSGQRLGGGSSTSRLLRDTSPPAQQTQPPRSNSPPNREKASPSFEQVLPVPRTSPLPPPVTSTPSPQVTKKQSAAPVQPLCDEDFAGYQPSERELRLRRALENLHTRENREMVAKAASLLHKIISNIVQNPSEDKYRSIRKTNRLFATQVACYPECLDFLQAVGFEDQPEHFILARNDPALLWIGRSSLEKLLPQTTAP
ncbi:hypothetical protein Poli38472_000838 [Pythium oligandrum]|uniref:WLM domain-containing protein n=1 Tax=Pythium oligandrum TaxID=41045 RepID=A0A8K1FFQ2_PYTOL|nr:hypothetical protein Poli38472_000838 [Pythium oligandrum]|eukprot:TMW60796.1 hypothetical protein Poli38472_000838 [Pythium oligandrum]